MSNIWIDVEVIGVDVIIVGVTDGSNVDDIDNKVGENMLMKSLANAT